MDAGVRGVGGEAEWGGAEGVQERRAELVVARGHLLAHEEQELDHLAKRVRQDLRGDGRRNRECGGGALHCGPRRVEAVARTRRATAPVNRARGCANVESDGLSAPRGDLPHTRVCRVVRGGKVPLFLFSLDRGSGSTLAASHRHAKRACTMNNYIGKKLTLISKSDIRYEGTLYSLDPQDSSLTLTGGASRLPIRGSWTESSLFFPRDSRSHPSRPRPSRLRSAVVRHRGSSQGGTPDPSLQRDLRLDHLQGERHQGHPDFRSGSPPGSRASGGPSSAAGTSSRRPRLTSRVRNIDTASRRSPFARDRRLRRSSRGRRATARLKGNP